MTQKKSKQNLGSPSLLFTLYPRTTKTLLSPLLIRLSWSFTAPHPSTLSLKPPYLTVTAPFNYPFAPYYSVHFCKYFFLLINFRGSPEEERNQPHLAHLVAEICHVFRNSDEEEPAEYGALHNIEQEPNNIVRWRTVKKVDGTVVGELPLVGNAAPKFEAEAVFDQEFINITAFSDRYAEFEKLNTEILGVSIDSVVKNIRGLASTW